MADLHAYLDNQKAPWDLLALRTKYYENIVKAMLKSINVPIDQLEFIVGSSYQLSRDYNLDAYRLAAITTEHDAKKAGSEVVKAVEHPLLSGLIYPGLQALDEEYLKVDAQFGGTDQRKIFTYAEKYLPQLGYKKRSHLMNFMVPGLMGNKMSSSDVDSKIDLLDSAKDVSRKIKKAFCEEGNIQENGLLSFAKFVLYPIYSLNGKEGLKVSRKPEFGGDVVFKNYQELESSFADKSLHPGDLKNSITDAINELLEPIRKTWFEDPELMKLGNMAYPAPKKAKPAKTKPSKSNENLNTNTDISRFNIVVGKIVSIEKHPNADSLYVEKIDVGEEEPRTIVSGLVKHFKPEELEGHKVCILANLKPSKLRGIKSDGMVLCASTEESGKVEIVTPPDDCPVGERIVSSKHPGQADAVLNPKQKFYSEVLDQLKTNMEKLAIYDDSVLSTSKGPLKVKTLSNARIR